MSGTLLCKYLGKMVLPKETKLKMEWRKKLVSLHQGEFPTASLDSRESLGKPFIATSKQLEVVTKLCHNCSVTADAKLGELFSRSSTPPAPLENNEKLMLQKMRLESFPKNSKISGFLKQCLLKNPLFSSFSSEQLDLLVLRLKPQKFEKNAVIYTEGEPCTHFYLIQSGKVSSNQISLGKGACFAEISLLTGTSHSETARAASVCGLWACDKLSLRQIISFNDPDQLTHIKDCLELFSLIEHINIDSLLPFAKLITLSKNSIISKQSKPTSMAYFIQHGSLMHFREALTSVEYTEGDVVYVCNGVLISRTECELISIPLKLLQPAIIQMRDMTRWRAFNSSQVNLSTDLSDLEKKIIRSKAELIQFNAGEEVFDSESCEPHFFTVVSGEVESKGKKFGESKSFGFIHKKIDSISGRFVANTDVSVFVIAPSFLAKQLQDINASLKAHMTLKRNSNSSSINPAVFVPTLASPAAELWAEYQDIKQIGKGSFGKVSMVENKDTKERYALKSISIRNLIRLGTPETVINERNLLDEIAHPFILEFLGSYKDKNNLYILTELLKGGELYERIEYYAGYSSRDTFLPGKDWFYCMPKPEVLFYTASVSSVLRYLASKNIVYRDIKPENLLLDSNGFLKLIDFGFSRKLQNKNKTFTRCGTAEYFSPELLTNRGYDSSQDTWALGILTYELITGKTPFVSEKSQSEVFENILRREPDWDDLDPSAVKFMKGLLAKQPHKRMKINQVKESLFLKSINMIKLEKKDIKAPYIPEQRDFQIMKEEEEQDKGREVKETDYETWYKEF